MRSAAFVSGIAGNVMCDRAKSAELPMALGRVGQVSIV